MLGDGEKRVWWNSIGLPKFDRLSIRKGSAVIITCTIGDQKSLIVRVCSNFSDINAAFIEDADAVNSNTATAIPPDTVVSTPLVAVSLPSYCLSSSHNSIHNHCFNYSYNC